MTKEEKTEQALYVALASVIIGMIEQGKYPDEDLEVIISCPEVILQKTREVYERTHDSVTIKDCADQLIKSAASALKKTITIQA